MSDDGPYGPKYVAFIDYIMKSSWCWTVTYTLMLKCYSITGRIPLKKYSYLCNRIQHKLTNTSTIEIQLKYNVAMHVITGRVSTVNFQLIYNEAKQ